MKHCAVGYQNAAQKASNIFNIPTSKNIDLKSASGVKNQSSKLTMVNLIKTLFRLHLRYNI